MVLDARMPRPEPRLNLTVALVAAAGAGLAYLAVLFTDALPPRSITVALLASVPVSALVALVIVRSRAVAGDDPRLHWLSTGLSVSLAALVLQLVAFPLFAPGEDRSARPRTPWRRCTWRSTSRSPAPRCSGQCRRR